MSCYYGGAAATLHGMYLVELAVEGLTGFPGTARLHFRGQLDVVRLDSSDARGALVDVLFHTLYPDPERADATRHLVRNGPHPRRSVLTLAGRDRVPYRMMRDLDSGGARLYRYDRTARTHELLSESGREAHQFLRVQHQLPDDASYERLFTFAADARPSLGDRARSRCAPAALGLSEVRPSGPGLPRAPAGPSAIRGGGPSGASGLTQMFPLPSALRDGQLGARSEDVGFSMHNALVQEELEASGTLDMEPDATDDTLQTRLGELRDALSLAKRAERAEKTLAALEEKDRAAQEALTQETEAQAKLQRVEAKLRSLGRIRSMSEQDRLLVEGFQSREAGLRADLERVEGELARAQPEDETPVRPALKDPVVLGGLGAATLSIGSALALGQPWLLLGQVVGGTLAGWWSLRRQDELEVRRSRARRVSELEADRDQLLRQSLEGQTVVRRRLAELGARDLDELNHQFDEAERWEQERVRLRGALEGSIGARGRRAREILHKIQERREACERAIARRGIDTRSSDSLRRRIARLESEIRDRGFRPAPREDSGGLPVVLGTADLPTLTSLPPVASASVSTGDGDEDEQGYGDGYLVRPVVDEDGSADPDMDASPRLAAGLFGGGGGSRHGAFGYNGGPPPPDRTHTLIETAADLVGKAFETLFDELGDRPERYVKALTGRRLTSVVAEGGRLVFEGPEDRFEYAELEGELLDQVDVGFRFALLESVLPVRRVPLIIEEPVAVLPPERRSALLRIYRRLARFTQVLVVTPADDLDGYSVPLEGSG